MPHKFCAASLLIVLILLGCAGVPKATTIRPPTLNESLAEWLPKQEARSWALLQRNISPLEPKVAGGPKPLPGIVVAGLNKKDPDYYFHWVRDSANVMHTLVEVTASRQPGASGDDLRTKMRDFLLLTERLQKLDMGEPRFTVEGQVDKLPWSRPQFDGPALRALALMRYLAWLEEVDGRVEKSLRQRLLAAIKRDLEFVGRVYRERGFDIWEELRADNYNTRLVQMVALEKSTHWFGANYKSQARTQLQKLLDDHWDPARGFLRAQLAIAATDGYTAKKTDLDSAVIVTVVDVDREGDSHSVSDPRVQATVLVLENLFRDQFPLNQWPGMGLGYGRYQGDVYFGGNPWFLITAAYAQFYARLAHKMEQSRHFTISKINWPFVQSVLGSGAAASEFGGGHDVVLAYGQAAFAQLHARLIAKADGIFRRLQMVTPADGDFFEQFDKRTGVPLSARGLAWAHSEYLRAFLERVNCHAAATN